MPPARPGAGAFERYRAKFDALWELPPFAGQSTDLAAGLDSKGPRTTRARNIFKKLYVEDPAFKAAYDANAARLKEQVDTYLGPGGLNLVDSPRLQRLRAAFLASPAAVTTARAVRHAEGRRVGGRHPAGRRRPPDRRQLQRVATPDQRTGARPGASRRPGHDHRDTAACATAATACLPRHRHRRWRPAAKITPQQFVDGATLDGPAAAIVGDHRSEPATLRPKSPVPNPGVAVDTRITLAPAKQVDGAAVSPTSHWPPGSAAGAPFTAMIRSEAAAVDATLELVNGPVARAARASHAADPDHRSPAGEREGQLGTGGHLR